MLKIRGKYPLPVIVVQIVQIVPVREDRKVVVNVRQASTGRKTDIAKELEGAVGIHVSCATRSEGLAIELDGEW
jgi:hypothetical protein